jgi:hypothetical protein
MSAPAIVGVGGDAMLPCPMRWIANWQARLKRMNSITRLARRAKQRQAGKSTWDAGRVVVARSTSRAGAMTTKIDQR